MSTAINLHLVMTLAVMLLSSNTFPTYVTLTLLRKALSRLAVCNLHTKYFYFRFGKGLQNLYSSPVVKHYFNNLTLRGLNSERRIYQRGALQNVNHMSNVYAMCAYVCPLLQRFGTSSVVLKTLELGVVGLPHQMIEDLSSNDASTVVKRQQNHGRWSCHGGSTFCTDD